MQNIQLLLSYIGYNQLETNYFYCKSVISKTFQENQSKDNFFSVFLFPFHSDAISGLDICHRKPLIVTSSLDKTIRYL